MFLIHCPYCNEEREQEEFSPAGEAFIARPVEPEGISDEAWADYVFYRTNHKRSEEHTSELQSRRNLVCRLLLEKKKTTEKHTSDLQSSVIY